MTSVFQVSYVIATVNLCAIHSDLKIRMLHNFILANNIDIILMQEVAITDFSLFSGYQAIVNNDEKLRGTAILIRDVIEYSDVRYLDSTRGISVKVNNLRIVNVYAPSGSQNQTSRELFFSHDIFPIITGKEKILLGGDFNCIINDSDSTNPSYSSKSKELKKLVSVLQLRDVWLHKCQLPAYTYFHANTATRLDRFYLSSENTELLGSIWVHSTPFTDHRAVIVNYKFPRNVCKNFFKHRGPWKLNNSILDDRETNDLFLENWKSWLKIKNKYPDTLSWWCSYAKQKIQIFLKWRSGIINRQRRSKLEFLMSCLNQVMNSKVYDNTVYANIKKYKALIINEQRLISEGVKYRSGNYCRIEHEKASMFHLLRERGRTASKTIAKIEHNGIGYVGGEEVSGVFHSFFTELYSNKSGETGHMQYCSNLQKRLTDNINAELQAEISSDEIKNCIKYMPKNKSPGPDGLSLEFYAHFWDTIAPEITLMANEIRSGVNVPQIFKKGAIVLIPKCGTPKSVNDYRPISLLNADYKIFMKCLKYRMSEYISEFISKEQTCLDKNNNILCALNKLREEIVIANKNRKNNLLLSVDFDHAFDRVDHGYLWAVMKAMNFSPSFTNVIKNMYTDSTSTLQINGNISREIPIKCGVRQGCPLSMLLFAITLEPLLESIRTANIDAIAYADDLSLIIRDNTTVRAAKDCIDSYSSHSGACLNMGKCESIKLGPNVAHAPVSTPYDWFKLGSQIKILGIIFTNNLHQMIKINWCKITNAVRNVLMFNKNRDLTLVQRVYFINTYALSKAWYVAQLLPIPVMVSKRVASFCGWFLWAKSACRVARNTATLAKSKGGLALIDVWHKANALLINNVVRAIKAGIISDIQVEDVCNPPCPYTYPHHSPHVRRFLMEAAYIPGDVLSGSKASSKLIYMKSLEQMKHTPNIITRLVSENINWPSVFANINEKILNHEQKSLLYRVVHDAYPFNGKLFVMGKADSGACDNCKIDNDTLLHRFECYDYAKRASLYIVKVIQSYTGKVVSMKDLLRFNFRFAKPCQNQIVTYFVAVSVEYVLGMAISANTADFKKYSVTSCRKLKHVKQETQVELFVKCLKGIVI